jgi:hypothetical protein
MSEQNGTSLWAMFVAVFMVTLFVKVSLWIIDVISRAIAGEDNFMSKSCTWAGKKIDAWKEKRKAGKKKAEVKEVPAQS